MEEIELKDLETEEIELDEIPEEEIEVKEVYVKEIKTVEIEKNIKGLNGKDGTNGTNGKNGLNGKNGKTPTKSELKALIKEVFPEDKLLEKLIKRMPKHEVDSIEIGEDRGGKFIKKDGKKMYLTSGIGPVMSTGVHDFLHLTDAPSSYVGQAGKIVKVKADETGLEFGTGGGGGGTVDSVVAGHGIDVDATDPANPIVAVDESELDHNLLGGLQGGTTGQYNHLTNAQLTVVQNTSGTNTGDQTITLTGAVTGSGTGSFATTLSSGIDATKIADGSVNNTEFQYINSLTSNAQTQIDTINTTLSQLDQAVILKGLWDASAGTFPGGGVAQAGWSYIVSVAGTVDGVSFVVNDRIIAITDNASTTTFLNNWFKADYTDQVLSVNGDTGAVVVDLQSATDEGNVTTNDIEVAGVTTPWTQFDTGAIPITNAEGLMQWNDTDGTLDLGMSAGDVTLQIGQEMFAKVRNTTGVTIDNGTPVYYSGSLGNRPLISPAQGNTAPSGNVAGVTTQDIANNSDGFITTMGYVRHIKTNYSGSGIWGTTWAEGDILYVSKTNPGVLTNVEPAVPHFSDIVGQVGVVGALGTGSILVRIQHATTLESLSDVNGTPLTTSGQIPVWNNTGGYFDFIENINDKVDGNAPITGATKTKITYDTKGLVTAGADATTADIADSSNKRYVTDAQLTVIGNTSGTNSGNQTITNTSDATSHTVTLSASGGSVQLIEGSNITLTTGGTASAGTVTIASTGGGTPTAITVANEATDTTCFPSFFTAATGDLGPKTNTGLTYNSSTSNLGSTIMSATTIELGAGATDTTLSRASAGQLAVEGVNVLMNGGALGTPSSGTVTNLTGTASININGTVGATTPTTGTFTTATVNTGLEVQNTDTTITRASAGDINVEGNIVYRAGGADVPVTDGGTGRSTGTTAYSLIATGTTATGAQQTLANGATTEILVGGGASALPVWTTATGSGAPVRATSPALVTPDLGTPSALVGTNITGTGASYTAGQATAALGLKSATTTVSVSGATAPSSGQALVATSSTAATWQSISGGYWDFAYKMTADFTVTNSSTFTDVTGMSCPVAAGECWYFEIMGSSVASNATGDIKIEIQSSGGNAWNSGSGGLWIYRGPDSAGAQGIANGNIGSQQTVLGSAGGNGRTINDGDNLARPFYLNFQIVTTGATDVKLQTANVSPASGRTSTIKAGTYMLGRKLT